MSCHNYITLVADVDGVKDCFTLVWVVLCRLFTTPSVIIAAKNVTDFTVFVRSLLAGSCVQLETVLDV